MSHVKARFSSACAGVGGKKIKRVGLSCEEDFVQGNLGAMGHVGIGGLTSSMKEGVGAGVGIGGKSKDELNFVGIGGSQSSEKIGVSSFSHINMLRLMIDDRRRMLMGDSSSVH